MFTPKANSEQKWVKKHKKRETEVLTARTARVVHTHDCAKKGRVYTHDRAKKSRLYTHDRARLTAQLFLRFSVFTILRIKFKPLIGF